jgi:hypothetical protein
MSKDYDEAHAEFTLEMFKRHKKGRKEYGDKSFSRSPVDLIGEIREELLDVANWAFILATRLDAIDDAMFKTLEYEEYVVPGFGDRVGGITDAAKKIQHTYYDHDDLEVIDVCDWCGDDIYKGQLYFAGGEKESSWVVCSMKCRNEYRESGLMKGPGGSE